MTNRQQQSAPTLWMTIVRCLPAALVLLAGFVVLCAIQFADVSITGKPTRDITLVIVVTEVAAYVAIRVLARISFRRQLAAIAVLCGLQFCLYLSIRIDGFMGDGRPILTWSWKPTHEGYTAVAPSQLSPAESATADLATTTPFDSPAFRGSDRSGSFSGVTLSRDWSRPA